MHFFSLLPLLSLTFFSSIHAASFSSSAHAAVDFGLVFDENAVLGDILPKYRKIKTFIDKALFFSRLPGYGNPEFTEDIKSRYGDYVDSIFGFGPIDDILNIDPNSLKDTLRQKNLEAAQFLAQAHASVDKIRQHLKIDSPRLLTHQQMSHIFIQIYTFQIGGKWCNNNIETFYASLI